MDEKQRKHLLLTHTWQGPYTVTNCHSGLHDIDSLDLALKLVANADDPDGRVYDANGTPVAANSEEAYLLWCTGRSLYGPPKRRPCG